MESNARCIRFLVLILSGAAQCFSQMPEEPAFKVDVDMVVLTFTVTDSNGRYIHGLKPFDLKITEDGVAQKIMTFAEGAARGEDAIGIPAETFDGSHVFVLFDTSNCMYEGFAKAADAVADFIRRLDSTVSVAVYGFSRNLFRAVALTLDHDRAVSGVRNVVVGQDTALYNAVLLTLRDAARQKGRKSIVVFSNGPDTSSMVSPDEVAAIAEDEGIPIFIVSTRGRRDGSTSAQGLTHLTEETGGRVFWAHEWREQDQALSVIREGFASTYTVAYYPTSTSNREFRKVSIDLAGQFGSNYHVQTRSGYRPRPDSAQ